MWNNDGLKYDIFGVLVEIDVFHDFEGHKFKVIVKKISSECHISSKYLLMTTNVYSYTMENFSVCVRINCSTCHKSYILCINS